MKEYKLKTDLPQTLSFSSAELAYTAARIIAQGSGRRLDSNLEREDLAGWYNPYWLQNQSWQIRVDSDLVSWLSKNNPGSAPHFTSLSDFLTFICEPVAPSLRIGEYECEFRDGGVQVGCTFVSREQVRAVLARIEEEND